MSGEKKRKAYRSYPRQLKGSSHEPTTKNLPMHITILIDTVVERDKRKKRKRIRHGRGRET